MKKQSKASNDRLKTPLVDALRENEDLGKLVMDLARISEMDPAQALFYLDNFVPGIKRDAIYLGMAVNFYDRADHAMPGSYKAQYMRALGDYFAGNSGYKVQTPNEHKKPEKP